MRIWDINNKAMVKQADKTFVYNLVMLIGAKLSREKLLEKIKILSSTPTQQFPHLNMDFVKAKNLQYYGGLLTYLEDTYREQLSK